MMRFTPGLTRTLPVLVVVTALGALAYATAAFEGLELRSVDKRFAVRGEQNPPADLIVVQIDDTTFDALNLRWPFPRSVHAAVIDRISKDRPKSITYEVQFSEATAPSLTQLTKQVAHVLGLSQRRTKHALQASGDENDLALANAIALSRGKTALSFMETDKGKVNVLGYGPAPLRQIDARAGNGRFPADSGGVIRRFAYEIDDLKSLAVVSAEISSGRTLSRDLVPPDGAWIDYYGGPQTLKSVSFSDVARHKVAKGFFRGKRVVVGPSAPTLLDVYPTSTTTGDELMSGAEIQATALDTIRRGLPLRSVATWIDYLTIILAGLLTPLLSLRLRPGWALLIATGAGVLYAVAAFVLFNQGHIVVLTYPLITLAISALAMLAVYVHYVTVIVDHERRRDLFARFIPEDVLEDVLKQSGGVRLGGVNRTATVMFSDLRGFTSFAESLAPDQVITVLNRYLMAMVDDAIDRHGGTLVDYMGDGIMAVFGAPLESDDHADRALAAARDKLRQLELFNAWLRSEMGVEKSFRMGIGLNTGPVTSGNVGSLKRMAYTTIGDTTNTAARLEGMTKGTPYMLFMNDSTRAALSAQPEDLVFVDEFEIRGREQGVKVWSVKQAMVDERPGENFQSITAAHTRPNRIS